MLLYLLLIFAIAGVGLLVYGWWDTRRFMVQREEVLLPRLPKAFDGFTILQVSDLHNNAYGKDGRALIRAIQSLEFDCIAITGDLLDRHLPKRRDNAYVFLEAVCRLAPVYLVQGNHERVIPGWDRTKMDYQTLGARVLENETVLLYRGKDRVAITGAKDKEAGETIAACMVPNTCTVLLAHQPQLLPEYAKTDADLVLCGHAHGGQVRLFGRGLYSPNQGIFPKYTAGFYTLGKTTMYVSRGVGNHSFVPPRFFNRPEINLLTLKSPSR